MRVRTLGLLAPALLALAVAAPPAPAGKGREAVPVKVAPPATGAWHVDDEEVFDNLMEKLADLAAAGKLLPQATLKDKIKEGKARVAPAKPGTTVLAPEDVYKAALPGVFIVGSVLKDDDGEWADGRYASAWALTADGVLVSNWHVFEDLEKDETFGVADHKGEVFPVTDFLGGDKAADIAIFRIAAKDLTPLPVAEAPAAVGSWVGVLSHPGDQFYMYTQGHVSRYSKGKRDDGTVERWLNITAEYATGSSGSPVLNKYGAVVGMAAMTVSIDYGDDEPKPAPKDAPKDGDKPKPADAPKGKDEPKPADPKADKPGEGPKEKPGEQPGPKASTLQMVVKLAVPSALILKTAGAGPADGGKAAPGKKGPAKP